MSEEWGKLSVLEAKRIVASRIVQKVRENFRYDVDEQKIEWLKKKLTIFTINVCVPWFKTASSEGINISEEVGIICSAVESDIKILSRGKKHHKEVVFTRHLRLRKIVTNQIVEKIFRHRINVLADRMKAKDWFDDERQQIIEGIRFEARQYLPTSTESDSLIQECVKIYQIYVGNLFLYENDPKSYHDLADYEVLYRSIDQRAGKLLEQLPQNSLYRSKVEDIRVLAHQILENEGYSARLVQKINDQFKYIEKLNNTSFFRHCSEYFL